MGNWCNKWGQKCFCRRANDTGHTWWVLGRVEGVEKELESVLPLLCEVLTHRNLPPQTNGSHMRISFMKLYIITLSAAHGDSFHCLFLLYFIHYFCLLWSTWWRVKISYIFHASCTMIMQAIIHEWTLLLWEMFPQFELHYFSVTQNAYVNHQWG